MMGIYTSLNGTVAANPTSSKGLKTTQIFEMMHNYFSRKEGGAAIKKCQAVYNIAIKQKKGGKVVKEWGLDLKNGHGEVSVRPYPSPDATFTMTDEDFFKVCDRTLNPQIAFVQVRTRPTNPTGKDEDQRKHEEGHSLHP